MCVMQYTQDLLMTVHARKHKQIPAEEVALICILATAVAVGSGETVEMDVVMPIIEVFIVKVFSIEYFLTESTNMTF